MFYNLVLESVISGMISHVIDWFSYIFCVFLIQLSLQVYSVLEGELLVHRKELHVRTITAMTFFNPLKYLITGAQDGCS